MHICRRTKWHYVTLVAVAVVVRPTSAIIWLPLCAWHVWHVMASRRLLWRLLVQYIWRRWYAFHCLLRSLLLLYSLKS